jgi:hypothetical protein
MPERSNPNSLGNTKIRIGVDLMGSDTAPDVLLQGILQNFESHDPSLELVLIGSDELFTTLHPPKGISFLRAKEVITMEDDPYCCTKKERFFPLPWHPTFTEKAIKRLCLPWQYRSACCLCNPYLIYAPWH